MDAFLELQMAFLVKCLQETNVILNVLAINPSQLGVRARQGTEESKAQRPLVLSSCLKLCASTHTSFGLNMFLRAGYDFLKGDSD